MVNAVKDIYSHVYRFVAAPAGTHTCVNITKMRPGTSSENLLYVIYPLDAAHQALSLQATLHLTCTTCSRLEITDYNTLFHHNTLYSKALSTQGFKLLVMPVDLLV